MHIRRLFAIATLILIGGLLAACGSEDEDTEPTTTPAPTIVESTTEPTEAAEDATPVASPAATPVTAAATADAYTVTVTDESAAATP